jgi:serine/threonine protein kinase
LFVLNRDIELIESTGNKNVVGAELAVSAMLSSLVRRNVCPNFVLTRRVFTCPYEPPATHWGSEANKKPKGAHFSPSQKRGRQPREPQKKLQGKYQYMRMELCSEGDAEEYLKRQPDEAISGMEARQMIFQVAFALHAAADRFSLKHYDMKLLNVFLQKLTGIESETTIMRYGLGSHIFALEMPTSNGIIAKIADYGTANVQSESNGQPATIGQFTTLENTPPEFMILGDAATQGHGHDAFGFGLCMLHLFTGHAPYEEILEDVVCPPGLKRKLQRIWEDEESHDYSVVRSVVLADVHKDEDGVVIEGAPDGALYDTLYRFLVLFGVPENKFKFKENGKVWKAISASLEGQTKGRSKAYGRNNSSNKGPDAAQFESDQITYSVRHGSNDYIARARRGLEQVEGGMELLFSLVEFNPENRASVCDVLNSQFMIPLREDPSKKRVDDPSHHVMNFMAYSTSN